MKNCLILGGTGFLGRWLVDHLLHLGDYKIKLYSRNAAEELSKLAYPPELVSAVSGNFELEADFSRLVSGQDLVFHLISTTVPGSQNISLCEDIVQNAFPTEKLLNACVELKVKKFIYFSSGGTVYGPQFGQDKISETALPNPICSYGIQKLLNEKIIQMYGANCGLDYLILRLANPYGPYQNPTGGQGAIAVFTWRILNNQPITVFGDGENVRDYIDVRDAIDMVINVVNSPNKNCIYNIGSGIGTSINQIISMVESATDKRAEIIHSSARAVDVRSNILCVNRYFRDISEKRPRSLTSGIQDLVRFYKKAGKH